MKFNQAVVSHLCGDEFSNGFKAAFSGGNLCADRLALVSAIVANKKVIHIGCADHVPLIKKKLKRSRWLHGRISNVASRLIGFDIDKEAVDYISGLGVDGVYTYDVIQEDIHESVLGENWDYILLGEVVEHIGDPVNFLSNIKDKYGPYADFIIITAPNAFRWGNFFSALSNVEFINTDHRFWFTPFTLAKVACDASMSVDEFFVVRSFPTKNPVKAFFSRVFPLLNETIVMVAKLKNE